MTTFTIKALEDQYLEDTRRFILAYWGSTEMVTRGTLYNVLEHPGFIAFVDNEIQGALIYHIENAQCEVLLLQSNIKAIGIGAELIEQAKQVAVDSKCRRLWLITTNDNTHAIRWYQKRGFTIAAVHVNALAVSREIKPGIPLTGFDGIPLRDEIEFQILLAQ